jgi:hypothetical protein
VLYGFRLVMYFRIFKSIESSILLSVQVFFYWVFRKSLTQETLFNTFYFGVLDGRVQL